MIGLAITRMMMQDKWAEKYDPDNRFGINQYDYNLEKDYLFALQREWKNSIWDSDKVEKYVMFWTIQALMNMKRMLKSVLHVLKNRKSKSRKSS